MRLAIQDALWYWMALQFVFSLVICNLKNHLIPGEAAGIQPHLACDGHGPKGRLWCCAENEWNTRLSGREGEWDRRQLDESHFSAGKTWHIPLLADTSAFPYLQTLHQDQTVSSPHATFEVAQLYWKNNSAFKVVIQHLELLVDTWLSCHGLPPSWPFSAHVSRCLSSPCFFINSPVRILWWQFSVSFGIHGRHVHRSCLTYQASNFTTEGYHIG